jgi:hypothetical protein
MNAAARRAMLAGGAGLAAVWLLLPASPAPPLYDGLTGPAEAYRYLNPPPGSSQTGPPGSASRQIDVAGGSSSAAFLATDEQPPQAQFLVGDGALRIPAGAHTVTLQVKPVPPPPVPLPAGLGRVDGNVYEVSATADVPGQVTVSPTATTKPTIVLRGPSGAGAGRIARFDPGGRWTALASGPLGNGVQDMLAASTDSLGDFAIVLSGNPGSTGGSGGGGGSFPVVAVLVPVVAVVVLAGSLVGVRLSRSRAAASGAKGRGGGGRRR